MKWDNIPKDPEMNGKTIFEVIDTACEKHTLAGEKPTNLRDGFEQAFFDNEEEAIEFAKAHVLERFANGTYRSTYTTCVEENKLVFDEDGDFEELEYVDCVWDDWEFLQEFAKNWFFEAFRDVSKITIKNEDGDVVVTFDRWEDYFDEDDVFDKSGNVLVENILTAYFNTCPYLDDNGISLDIDEINRFDREDIIKTLKAEAMKKIEAGGEE